MAVFGEIPKEAERRRKLAEQKYSQEKAKTQTVLRCGKIYDD